MPIPSLLDEDDGRDLVRTKMRFRVSVSQIKMFHPDAGGCPRKWAMHYLSRVPRLPSPALTDGIRLHDCIRDHFHLSPEAWRQRWPTFWTPDLTTAEQARVKTAQLALAMIPHTPPGNMPPISESTDMLEVPEIDTAIYIKPDLHRDRRWFVDWKTTAARTKKSDWCLQQPDFWGDLLTEEEILALARKGVKFLQDDIQARVYAHGLMQLWREVRVTARWVYGSKKFKPTETPKTWIVEHTFERAETRAWVERNVWPTIETMNTIRAAFDQRKLDSTLLIPHNGDSCEHTGKFCDALGYCGFQPSPIPMGKLHLPMLPGAKRA